ncbi:MAG: hypothetical protein K0R29_2087 [Pseudobdellovibrio sp.]|jgi:hypothetical protein|nr:hypothetical protein [Pseudobdellovibrio sp.]
MKFFTTPILSLVIGIVIAAFFSWSLKPELGYVAQTIFTVVMLSVLEISLSFDNAVVNATVLQKMDEVWRKRFLTWGMAIAVFGMRLVFPLAIVSIIANVSVWDSLVMAFARPDDYAKMMTSAHLAVSAFGGSFLLMVFLDFLFTEKDLHWIGIIEKPAGKLSAFQSIELVIAISILFGIHANLPLADQSTFLVAYLWGLLTFLIVHGFSALLEDERIASLPMLSSGLGMFLYLEVLDASFSFDGVVGAFAISHQLLIIMIGLGVGAFFVRGITLYLVEHKTLEQFMFLEHGAFWALGLLAFFMLLDSFFHFGEAVTALSGAAVLGLSIYWSVKENRKSAASQNKHGT